MHDKRKIRVLVVDDSIFMRKLIVDLLHSDEQIEVVGEAKDGLEAVSLVKKLQPDVVTMDYNMPLMDGALATERILKTAPHKPAIIILSGHTKENVEEAFEGLRYGAIDIIFKPSGEYSPDIEEIKDVLISKIKIAAHAHVFRFQDSAEDSSEKVSIHELASRAVVIGASTGGPPVVEHIITKLPRDLEAAVLVVQHLPSGFTDSFAKLIDKKSSFKTKEAEDGEVIKNGICLIAPGGWHMTVEIKMEAGMLPEKLVHLTKEPPVNGYRPSVDVLMSSVAEKFGNKSIGVILTGMGKDGQEGARAIIEAGGYTIAQTPQTAVIESMPRAIIDPGLADDILDPEDIIQKIIQLSK